MAHLKQPISSPVYRWAPVFQHSQFNKISLFQPECYLHPPSKTSFSCRDFLYFTFFSVSRKSIKTTLVDVYLTLPLLQSRQSIGSMDTWNIQLHISCSDLIFSCFLQEMEASRSHTNSSPTFCEIVQLERFALHLIT